MAPAIVSDLALPSAIPESTQTPANNPHEKLFSLKNKTIAITGGARGLGVVLAAAVLEAGGNAACLDILPSPSAKEWAALEKIAHQANLNLSYRQCDITDDEKISQAMQEIAKEGVDAGAPFSGAIACAGI